MQLFGLLYLAAFLSGLFLNQRVPIKDVVSSSQKWITFATERALHYVPKRIEYRETVREVPRNVTVTVVQTVTPSTREMIQLVSRNLANMAIEQFWQHYTGLSTSVFLALLTMASIIIYLTYRQLMTGRPTNEAPTWMVTILNTFKQSRRAGEGGREPQTQVIGGATSAQHGSPALVMTLERPEKYRPRDNFERWISFFELYANQFAPQLKNPLLISLLDEECHQHGKFDTKDSYTETLKRLTKAFREGDSTTETITNNSSITKLTQFNERLQTEDETAVEYLVDLRRLCEQALPTTPDQDRQQMIKEQFIKGLRNEQLRKDLVVQIVHQRVSSPDAPTFSIEQLMDQARDFERFLYNKRDDSSSDSSSVVSASVSTTSRRVKSKKTAAKAKSDIAEVDTKNILRYLATLEKKDSDGQRQQANNNNSGRRWNSNSNNPNYNNYSSRQNSRNNNSSQPTNSQLQQQQTSPFTHSPGATQPTPSPSSSIPPGQPRLTTPAATPPTPQTHMTNALSTLPAPTTGLFGVCLVDDRQVKYEFDCGASSTCINTETFKEWRLNRVVSPFAGKVIAANGPLETHGTVEIQLTLGNTSFPLTVIIAKLDAGRTMLLGRDVYQHVPQFARPINDIKEAIRDSDREVLRQTTQEPTSSPKHPAKSADNKQDLHAQDIDEGPGPNNTPHPTTTTAEQDVLAIDQPIATDETPIELNTTNELDTEEYRDMTERISELLRSVAAASYKDLTPTDTVMHEIKLIDPSKPPFRQKMRRVPFSRREAFYKLLMEQVEAKLLIPSRSPYSSPVLLVSKPDGSIRLTIDYRWLNLATVKDAHPLPNIENLFVELSKSKFYTKIDCYSGFYQVQMDPASTQYTAFSCEWGLYEYIVMPMGLTNAPATFQRLMNKILHDEIKAGIVVVYMDDLLIHSKTMREHLEHVRRIIEKLRHHGIKIKLSKCEVAKTTVIFLGHEVSYGQIRPSVEKTKVLFEYPRPLTVCQLQSFLGLAGYYRKFIAGFAKIATPLYTLLQGHDSTTKNTKLKLEWNDDAEQSFIQLRNMLTTRPLLVLPNFDLAYILDTDACNYAIGAVLSQEQDSAIRPVAYFSKHLSPAQKNYSTSEKELLAIVLSVEYFIQYLWGNQFEVNTDHQPLQWLFKTAKPTARLARWLIRLSDYNFTINYKPGTSNANADAMSRWPLDADGPTEEADEEQDRIIAAIETILAITIQNDEEAPDQDRDEPIEQQLPPTIRTRRLEQFEDPDIQWAIDLIRTHNTNKPIINNFANDIRRQLFQQYDQLQVIDDVLYHITTSQRGDRVERFVLPRHLVTFIIDSTHCSVLGGHLGMNKTYDRLKGRFFRPGLKDKVEKAIRECDTCQKVKSRRNFTAPLQPILPSRPGELLATDLTGAMTKTPRGNRYAMVIVDHFTKFANIYALPNIEATTIADRLIDHMMKFGIVEKILSDLGTQLQSQVLELVYETLGIQRLRTTPYHPECDGISERLVQTTKKMLAAFVNERCDDWDLYVNKVAFAYNTSVHITTQQTPFELQFGRMPIIPIDLIFDQDQPTPRPRNDRAHDETVIDGDEDVTYLRDAFDNHNDKLPQTAKDYLAELKRTLKLAYEHATATRDHKMDKAKLIYDRKAHPDAYETGDLVLASHPAIVSGQTRGLAKKKHGPFRVLERIGPVDYLLQKANLTNAKKIILHQNNLTKYFGTAQATLGEDIQLKLETKKRQYTRRNARPANPQPNDEYVTEVQLAPTCSQATSDLEQDVSQRQETQLNADAQSTSTTRQTSESPLEQEQTPTNQPKRKRGRPRKITTTPQKTKKHHKKQATRRSERLAKKSGAGSI